MLGQRGLQYLMLEGGSGLNRAMLQAGLVDRGMFFIAPMLFGGDDGYGLFSGAGVRSVAKAYRLTGTRFRQVDTDILMEGEIVSCSQD